MNHILRYYEYSSWLLQYNTAPLIKTTRHDYIDKEVLIIKLQSHLIQFLKKRKID